MKLGLTSRVLGALSWVVLLGSTTAVHAQDGASEGAVEASEEATAPVGADEYTQAVQAGIALLVAGDAPGAMERFRAAVTLDGTRPQAVFYLATAQRMSGDLEQALSGFRAAARNAATANEARWQGRALQAVAQTYERMEGRAEESYSAWQEYVRFADAHQAVTHPQMGRARTQAYNVMNEQEQAYVAVRERIAERERANAASD